VRPFLLRRRPQRGQPARLERMERQIAQARQFETTWVPSRRQPAGPLAQHAARLNQVTTEGQLPRGDDAR
jgi:hypothetical protein